MPTAIPFGLTNFAPDYCSKHLIMSEIPESELIINARGAIYHLDVRPEEIANNIITVGDPDRVAEVSKHFDRIEFKCRHREFVTHTGTIGSKRFSVVGTGIGPDNVDIVLNELDALVNIDFAERSVKPQLTRLNIVRLGTCGSLQAEVPVDSLVAGTHGLGIDNLMRFYKTENTEEDLQILQAFITHTALSTDPYIFSASASLLKLFAQGYHHGITVTCPGFYGPQGRVLRLGVSYPAFVDHLTTFQFGPHRIANFEMETSAIYGLGKALGHNCLSLNAVIANRVGKTFSSNPAALVEKLIVQSLEIMEREFGG